MWELLLDTTVVNKYVLLQVRVLVLCPRRFGQMKEVPHCYWGCSQYRASL